MHVTTAVVLAAGIGRRLRDVVADRPKGFVEVGGLPIVERSLRLLHAAGVSRVVVVAGFEAHCYHELASRHPDVRVVENHRFADSGSLLSLIEGARVVDGPFVLLESDLIYEARALDETLALRQPNAVLLSGPTGAGDEVWVETSGPFVRAISKRRADLWSTAGELVGISVVDPPLMAAIRAYADRRFHQTSRADYEEAIAGVSRVVPVHHHLIADLAWAEIDDAAQLARARAVVWPRIVAAEARADRSPRATIGTRSAMSPLDPSPTCRLTRHLEHDGPRWAVDGRLLPASLTLEHLLRVPRADLAAFLDRQPPGPDAAGALLAPIEDHHEVWAAGVTYLRSREAREVESTVSDVYAKVYNADRPELFFKAIGRRVVGHGMPIRVREDSQWNVPEPELTLVVNAHGEVIGYCAGNDVSSRDIEGANPLYLPQAKVYTGSCALGPAIALADAPSLGDVAIAAVVSRAGRTVFAGDARTSQMKRTFDDLVAYLCRELDFPAGVFLMTGTGIVPAADFSLAPGDLVRITVGALALENTVAARA